MKSQIEHLCQICGSSETDLYPAGWRCRGHVPRWPSVEPSSWPVVANAETMPPYASAIFQESRPVAPETAPDGARRLYAAAVASGWEVTVTEALAGVRVLKKVRLNVGVMPDEDGLAKNRAGVRLTEDVAVPTVVRSIAVRCARADQLAVGVWWNGAAECGVLFGEVTESCGVVDLLGFVRDGRLPAESRAYRKAARVAG